MPSGGQTPAPCNHTFTHIKGNQHEEDNKHENNQVAKPDKPKTHRLWGFMWLPVRNYHLHVPCYERTGQRSSYLKDPQGMKREVWLIENSSKYEILRHIGYIWIWLMEDICLPTRWEHVSWFSKVCINSKSGPWWRMRSGFFPYNVHEIWLARRLRCGQLQVVPRCDETHFSPATSSTFALLWWGLRMV